ncbi:S41 family peptidase [Notoacmeibacter ruber]|uniref:S41 family peptidase n=1 Tax=Notoacmeibacter ruber TaxID=2670375 RepID=A0A3L7JDT1_9HYPH|nr:S41 family peptidase [Notoacmeibacter ruber]RLQ88948.1 S41 family peptidase [Notoacmeibacter ruber]
MIRKLSLLCAGALMGATAMTVVTNGLDLQAKAASSETYRQLAIFGDVLERVRSQYVTEPDEKELIQSAIKGMLASLDPHSAYLDPDEASDMSVQTRGEFGGLGIEVTMQDDLVKVITPMDDTPAMKAGVLAGDLIARIDGDEVRGLTLSEAVEKMRGARGEPIMLTILREGADAPIEIEVIRDIIKVKAVKVRTEGDVGYLKVTSFTEKTFADLEKGFKTIQKEIPEDELKGYVLDLRLNPGGVLTQAIAVSDAFLDRGKILSTRGRDDREYKRYDATPGDLAEGKPVIVLINGGSASASEIVAGALQDLRRATVLGTRSFGKGSVQTVLPLAENGALKLTTALYYLPSDASIQGKGITPDIIVKQPLPDDMKGREEDMKRGESSLRGHITGDSEDDEGSGSSAYVPPEAEDDLQLQAALRLLRGEDKDPAFPPSQDRADAGTAQQ